MLFSVLKQNVRFSTMPQTLVWIGCEIHIILYYYAFYGMDTTLRYASTNIAQSNAVVTTTTTLQTMAALL